MSQPGERGRTPRVEPRRRDVAQRRRADRATRGASVGRAGMSSARPVGVDEADAALVAQRALELVDPSGVFGPSVLDVERGARARPRRAADRRRR